MNEKTDKKQENRKICLTIFYWVSGFSFLFSIIAVCGVFIYEDVVIAKESIVLIFIGILATFVVVGNYAQAKETERKTERKIAEIEDGFNVFKESANETKKEIEISKTEFAAAVPYEISVALNSGNTYELQLRENIQAVTAYDTLINKYKKIEWKDFFENSFGMTAYLINEIEKNDTNINWTVEFIEDILPSVENMKDRRKDKIHLFLLNLKEQKSKQKAV